MGAGDVPIRRGRTDRFELWMDYTSSLLRSRLTRLPAEEIAHAITTTFDGVATADHRRRGSRVQQSIHRPNGPAPTDGTFNEYAVSRAETDHPLLRFYLAIGRFPVVQIDDVPERFASAHLKAEWFEEADAHGHGHQLAFTVSQGPHAVRSFVVGRGEAYSPDEMAVARRLRRLLVGIARQVAADEAWLPRDGEPSTDLSPRESLVIAGIARGLTAESIARALQISPRTVHKHLEHAYAKLGVRDRVSAVLRAQHLGLL